MSPKRMITEILAFNEAMRIRAEDALQGMDETHPDFGTLTQIVKDARVAGENALWLQRYADDQADAVLIAP